MHFLIQLQNLERSAIDDIERFIEELLGKHPNSNAVIQSTIQKIGPVSPDKTPAQIAERPVLSAVK